MPPAGGLIGIRADLDSGIDPSDVTCKKRCGRSHIARFHQIEATIETDGQKSWRRIAWNGLCFSAPADWEIGRIGLRYLELETETGPVLEVKWNRVKGNFSHKAHLRRLAGLHKRHLKKSFQVEMPPANWKRALEGYDVIGFSWQSEAISAKGVLLYDPASRVAALIQFYRQNNMPAETTAPRLLSSFRSRFADNVVPLAVFDIRASIPAEFGLQRFRFETGRYELTFSTRQAQLQMVRFSPAAIWLRRRDLPAIAQESFLPKATPSLRWLRSDATAAEGQMTPASVADRIIGRIRRRPVYRTFRLWHEVEKNRILGVQISGKHPVDRRQFAAICERYETI